MKQELNSRMRKDILRLQDLKQYDMIFGNKEKRFWSRKTMELSYCKDIEEIWKYRYFLNWDSQDLNNAISIDTLKKEPDFWYFINYDKWTRGSSATRMDSKFFHENIDKLNIVYIFEHSYRFPGLSKKDFTDELSSYQLKKISKSVCVHSTCAGTFGECIGIPTNIPNQYDFGREQLDIIRRYKKESKLKAV